MIVILFLITTCPQRMYTAGHVFIRQMVKISSSSNDPTPSLDEDLQYGSVHGGNVAINSKMIIKRQKIKEPNMQVKLFFKHPLNRGSSTWMKMITDLIYHINDSSKEFSFLYCEN